MGGRYYSEVETNGKDEISLLEMKKKCKEYLVSVNDSRKCRGKSATKTLSIIQMLWKNTFAKLGEDWVFLALLGVVMAVLSFFIDFGINHAVKGRLWMYKDLSENSIIQYIVWVSLPVLVITFSANFVHIIAPQSIGSGIPEMKTILRGVSLKEYLTFRCLFAKVLGTIATLGCGLPLGKEGPFVHISCILATLMCKMITSFKGIYENESRKADMLAAACAVGVATCFGSPIGGVLFSIEVTTAYFPVRNYWRGFFSAVCGAACFRLIAVWFDEADTVKAFYQTHFQMEYPFDPQELMVFALIGAISGFSGAFYVWLHRNYKLLIKKNSFLHENRLLYPGIITFIVSTISFPLFFGKYCASDRNTDEQLTDMFSNFTWTKNEFSIHESHIISHWTTENTNIFISLIGYFLFHYIFSFISYTIPIPAGSFIPLFKIGAAFGRIIGELMQIQFPNGITRGKYTNTVIPGGYATVGAAAFAGAVTHSFSVSVIAFEVTGQITHIVPMTIAVLIANAVACRLQPSLYDSIILMKKLPYLPEILPSCSTMYSVYVENFMVRDVKYIWKNMKYKELIQILKSNSELVTFPLVDNSESMILLGSVKRLELMKLIENHCSIQKWAKTESEKRKKNDDKSKESDKSTKHASFQSSKNEETEEFSKQFNGNKETLNFEEKTDEKDKPSSSNHNGCKKIPPNEYVIEMLTLDQIKLVEEEMEEEVNIDECHIDPAPFQLVERTTMLKVHSIFSLLGIDRAYVTAIGRLVGVVGLRELRKAIEDSNAGGSTN